MKCVCIGSMNDNRLLILDCLTEDIYCLEHDELLFSFDSQEDYDKKMPTKAVCFPDFTSLLDWCTGGDYLKGVMNGKTALPVKAWKAEYAKLTAERETLNRRYLALKDEVKGSASVSFFFSLYLK